MSVSNKENASPQPINPPNVSNIMAGVYADMEDRGNGTRRRAASTKQERNREKAEKRPFSGKLKTDDITQKRKQTARKATSTRKYKSKLTTGGQVILTGKRPDDPRSIENE